MITTNDADFADKLKLYRVHGMRPRYEHHVVGVNSRLDTIQAAVLLTKLPHLDRWTEEELQETDSLETTLSASGADEDDYVPVQFQSRVTELGVFELWCVSSRGDDRWRLEFSVRE